MKYFVESCCASQESVRRAVQAGTARIELCQDLATGGVTPAETLIHETLQMAGDIPVNVLVRPRPGSFVYTEEEVQAMLSSIRSCKDMGVNGVVLGALTPDGHVDKPTMDCLLQEAAPLHVTFHRAFDVCANLSASLEEVIDLGMERILTSGGYPDAFQGRFVLQALIRQAAGRIVVMPGCGITPANLETIAAITGATEFHGSRLP